MKVYTKVVIDMTTLEIEDAEGFEYDGEVALCGGSDPSVDYTQSSEQEQMYEMLFPQIQAASEGGGWPISQPPDPRDEIPSMQGVMSGVPMYGIPSSESLQPTQQWWQGVSPDVKAGLWQPYKEAGAQLSEMMGGRGQWGSMRGGPSGAAGAAMGKIASEGAMQVPLQAWGMGEQGRMAGYQAELGRSQQDYQNRLRESLTDYGRHEQAFGGGMERWRQSQSLYGAIPGMMGGTYSQPVVDPGSPDQTGQILGTVLSAVMMAAMGSSDIRLKKNIKPIGTYKGFDVIEFEYLWGNEKNTGLIAQQVQKVKPEAVGKLPNGYLYINYALV